MSRFPALFISHGSPALSIEKESSSHKFLSSLSSRLLELSGSSEPPSAIIVFSAHWEEKEVKITHWNSRPLIYDFYGFPQALYKQTYSCPGSLSLSSKIQSVLNSHNISCSLDTFRGLDHGTWSPLKIIYPSAEIPVIQISLLSSLSESEHVKIGKSLKSLFSENQEIDGIDLNRVLIIGSGGFTHNLSAVFSYNESTNQKIRNFGKWAKQVILETNGEERIQKLSTWRSQQGGKEAHPREEHWIPIFVILGLSQKPSIELYDEWTMGSFSMASFAFPL